MSRNGTSSEVFNEREAEVFKQVGIGLRQTLASPITPNSTNRPTHNLPQIQAGLVELGTRNFTGQDNFYRLDLALDVNLVPDGSRTAVSDIILSIKRQTTGIDIKGLLGKLVPGFLRKRKRPETKHRDQNTYLKLTPNGYQISDNPEALARRQGRLMEYKPEAADPIGEITTEFLTHLRKAVELERSKRS
ncbi:hypothetical protein HY604_02830 [Candidatus Peregrinibacteria bacterium]|nr:hypothetical protein [Candidatus Peregrinibacteria bacterium]